MSDPLDLEDQVKMLVGAEALDRMLKSMKSQNDLRKPGDSKILTDAVECMDPKSQPNFGRDSVPTEFLMALVDSFCGYIQKKVYDEAGAILLLHNFKDALSDDATIISGSHEEREIYVEILTGWFDGVLATFGGNS